MRWLRSDKAEYLHLDWQRVAYVVVQGDFSAATPRYADDSHVFVLDGAHNHEYVRAIRAGIAQESDRWVPLRAYVTGSSADLLSDTTIWVSKPHILRMFDTETPWRKPGVIAGMEVDVTLIEGAPPLGIAIGAHAEHARHHITLHKFERLGIEVARPSIQAFIDKLPQIGRGRVA